MGPDPRGSDEPHRSRRPALIRLAVFAALLVAIVLGLRLSGVEVSPEAIRDRGERLGPVAAVLVVPVTVALSSIGVPAPVLGGGAGLLFGTLYGAILAHVAITLSACLQMLASRHLARGRPGRLVPERLRGVDDFLERRGFFAVLYYRIVPGLPFIALNYAAGLTKLRLRDMALGTFIGKAPRTWAYAALGGNLDDLGSTEARVAIALLVGMAIVGAVLAGREIRAERRAAREPA